MKLDSVVSWIVENTSRPRTLAPGAAPVILMSHGDDGRVCEALMKACRLYTVLPWAPIELESRNASPPDVGVPDGSPVKSTCVSTGEPAGEPAEA